MTDRDQRIVEEFKAGKSMADLGRELGLSRERVRQILGRHGLSGEDGGFQLRMTIKREEAKSAKDRRTIGDSGFTLAERRELADVQRKMLRDGYGLFQTPPYAFRGQRNNAKHRGIEWKLTMKEWWGIWVDSGKWDKRGRGPGVKYVMCRIGDEGPYEVGNVFIGTNGQNARDAREKHNRKRQS